MNKRQYSYIPLICLLLLSALAFGCACNADDVHARENFVSVIGFDPPWEEVEFQVLNRYWEDGKIEIPDYVAKYVIDKDQLEDAIKTIEDAEITYSTWGRWYWIPPGFTYWIDNEKNPNNVYRSYDQQDPVPWWEISAQSSPFDVMYNYFNLYEGSSHELDIFIVRGSEEKIYIYIYAQETTEVEYGWDWPASNSDLVFNIKDMREDKSDLKGKYICDGWPDDYFEVFEDYAVLCEGWETIHENDYKCMSQTLEISISKGATFLRFICEDNSPQKQSVLEFKSRVPDNFEYLAFFAAPGEYIFRKQGSNSQESNPPLTPNTNNQESNPTPATNTNNQEQNLSIRTAVMKIAEQEYENWIDPETINDHKKYTNKDNDPAWGAYFVNWVYAQAGYPIPIVKTDSYGAKLMESNAYTTEAWARSFKMFTGQGGYVFYPADSGYQPKIGDIAVYEKQVNIIVDFAAGKRITIGGNESNAIQRNHQDYMTKYFGAPKGYVTYEKPWITVTAQGISFDIGPDWKEMIESYTIYSNYSFYPPQGNICYLFLSSYTTASDLSSIQRDMTYDMFLIYENNFVINGLDAYEYVCTSEIENELCYNILVQKNHTIYNFMFFTPFSITDDVLEDGFMPIYNRVKNSIH